MFSNLLVQISISIIFSLSVFFSRDVYSQQNQQENSETKFDKESSEIYQSLGVSEIPKEAFDQAFIAFQTLKGQGKISKLPLITFVNFSIASNRIRYFVVDLQSKNIVLKSKVAHGKNSGGVASPATSFSNADNSLQSSLGFYLTGESYSGKHGISLRLDGLSGNLNSNARDRAIVIHAASYVEGGGRSYGCLALPPSINTQAIELLKNKTLIYTFTNNQYAKLGDKNSAIIASSDKSYNSPPNVSSIQPEFPEFDSIGNLSSAAPSIGLVGAGATGVTLLKGTEKYEGCQNLSNKSWADTVKGIDQGINPSSFFTGSWAQLRSEVTENEIDNEDAVKFSLKRLSDINDCVAVAHVSTRSDFSKENINSPDSKSTTDGKIKCVYNNPESQDYSSCLKSIETYEALSLKEKEIHVGQVEDFKESNKEKINSLNINNAQQKSLEYSKASQSSLSDISLARAKISSEKLNLLQAIASKIPTKESLFDECESKFNKHGVVSKDEFSSFVRLYSSKGIEPKLESNHCLSAVANTVNPIQNEVARSQIKSVLKEYGKEVSDYTTKSSAFINRGNGSPLLDATGSLGFDSRDNSNSRLTNELNTIDNQLYNSPALIFNSTLNHRGASDSGSVSHGNLEDGGSLNNSNNDFTTASFSQHSSENWGKGSTGAPNFVGDESYRRGIYSNAYYEKIDLALNNPEILDKLNLSREQMKDYLERKKYLESLSGQNVRTPASTKTNVDGEIFYYHEKGLNLFEIISKKYQDVFNRKFKDELITK